MTGLDPLFAGHIGIEIVFSDTSAMHAGQTRPVAGSVNTLFSHAKKTVSFTAAPMTDYAIMLW